MASRTSCLAGCCVASPHLAASHLLASPTLIAPLPLVAPWPPVPLVQLVVALPPLLILLVRPCLSTCHLHLPPPVCLLFAPAGCCIASCCAAFATHPLDRKPPLNALNDCSGTSCCPAFAAHPLGTLLPLDALPTPPTPICLSFALDGCHVTSCCIAPLIVSTCCHLSMRWLVVALPPVALPSQLILLTCRSLSAFQLVDASPLIALPLLLILSLRPCLSMHGLHLPLSVCLSFAPAGCHIRSHSRCFTDVGAREKGSTLHLSAPSVNKDATFQPIDMTAVWVD